MYVAIKCMFKTPFTGLLFWNSFESVGKKSDGDNVFHQLMERHYFLPLSEIKDPLFQELLEVNLPPLSV